MPNLAKEKEQIDLRVDLAGLAHIHKAYLRGVKTMILSVTDFKRAAEWRRRVERMLTSSGYMTEAEVKLMDGGVKIQRYLTEDDAKLGG